MHTTPGGQSGDAAVPVVLCHHVMDPATRPASADHAQTANALPDAASPPHFGSYIKGTVHKMPLMGPSWMQWCCAAPAQNEVASQNKLQQLAAGVLPEKTNTPHSMDPRNSPTHHTSNKQTAAVRSTTHATARTHTSNACYPTQFSSSSGWTINDAAALHG